MNHKQGEICFVFVAILDEMNLSCNMGAKNKVYFYPVKHSLFLRKAGVNQAKTTLFVSRSLIAAVSLSRDFLTCIKSHVTSETQTYFS